jgi:DNA-binding transcriptional LysR family regulator
LLLTEVGTILGTCLSGVGVAQIKALGIRELLDDGRLVDLFPDWPDKRFPLYALYPSRHLPAAKVRAFIDFVMAAVSPKAEFRPAASTRERLPAARQKRAAHAK